MSDTHESEKLAGQALQRLAPPSAPAMVSDVGGLVGMALSRGAGIEMIRELIALKNAEEDRAAQKAFVQAMSAFKANPPEILKSKKVDIPGGAKFAHATLADVVDAAIGEMGNHGLSHKWETTQEGNKITVTCIITHVLGHSERTTLTAMPDDSGKKNQIQQVASTVSYLSRYTLMSALGLAAKDMDDDGRGSSKPIPRLTQEHAATIQALVEDVKPDMGAFFKYMSGLCKVGIGKIEEIPENAYGDAVAALQRKAKQAKEPK